MVRIRAGWQLGQPLGPAAQVCLEGPSHPLILGSPWEHPHRGGDWAQVGSQAAAEPGEAGWAGREGSWRLGTSPQTALCSSGVAASIGSTIHTQLRSSVYGMLASLLSLGQGEWDQRPGWCLRRTGPTLTRPQNSFAALAKPHPWLCPRIPLGTLAQILPECALEPFPL